MIIKKTDNHKSTYTYTFAYVFYICFSFRHEVRKSLSMAGVSRQGDPEFGSDASLHEEKMERRNSMEEES